MRFTHLFLAATATTAAVVTGAEPFATLTAGGGLGDHLGARQVTASTRPRSEATPAATTLKTTATKSAGAEACATALASMYSGMPTPPSALSSILSIYRDVKGAKTTKAECAYTIPNILIKAWSSYQASLASWASANNAKVSSAMSLCPQYSAVAAPYVPVCTEEEERKRKEEEERQKNAAPGAQPANVVGAAAVAGLVAVVAAM